MREITYHRHEFTSPDPETRTASLLVFVYDIPYFDACGVFPPRHIANAIFREGGSEGGMSPGATWEPFELSEAEYAELARQVESVDLASFAGQARYTWLKFVFDPSFDGLQEHRDWLRQVCEKHREAYRERLRTRSRTRDGGED